MLSAKSLELYSNNPRSKEAAREINAALKAAKIAMKAQMEADKRYSLSLETPMAIKACYQAGWDIVSVVLSKYSDTGALDTEPQFHCREALVLALAKIARFSQWETEKLKDRLL